MRRKHLLKGLAAAGIAAITVLAACSLGLDASKLTVLEEAGVGPTVDGAPDVELKPGETRCASDPECNDGGCLTGKCLSGVCKYEICPTAEFPCQHRTCGPDNKCSDPPTPHKFVAQRMTLGHAGLGCNDGLGACVAVVYPFAFVGPKTGDVAAYPIVDLGAPPPDAGEVSPPPVKLENVAFSPTRIVANRDRVWLIGPRADRGNNHEVPIAWIDVPTNPQLTSLPARTGTLTLPQTGDVVAALPGADKGLIVLLSDGSAVPRAAQLAVVDGGVTPDTPFNQLGDYDGSAPIVASSGDRLITARTLAGPPGSVLAVNIIAHAGAANATTLGEQNLALTYGPVYPGATFAATPSGAVVAQAPVAALDPQDASTVLGVDSVRAAWVLQRADDTSRVATPAGGAAMITYPDSGYPPSEQVGPLTSVGEDAIFALQAEGDGGSSIRVVRRNATAAALDPQSQASLAEPPFTYLVRGAVSEVTNKLYGYTFTRPTSDADGVHLTIYELGCGP